MATTAVAVGKIEMQLRKGESIPKGWAQGPDGKETTDAALAYETQCLMPLGGAENTSGYKGFGLSAMVELFCGILSGSLYGHHIRSWSHSGEGGAADLGQCFVALDPGCFAPGFQHRLADCMQHWRQLQPVLYFVTIQRLLGEYLSFYCYCYFIAVRKKILNLNLKVQKISHSN
ncbi:L-sulfolactate dehydrogenase [Papilio machaon]|uniref:L-sulfolactate dehydrogenase n=1 Tax=Papilio machaon TaxID=76193 RepID=A0A0N0PG12_PAPMA|nr:L-sulfolactate dehydrogenase [Papilio machaon]